MSEILIPWEQLASSAKGKARLSRDVGTNLGDPFTRRHLRERNLRGTLARYPKGSEFMPLWERNVRHAINPDNPIQAFAIIGENGRNIGTATVLTGLELRLTSSLLPAVLARKRESTKIVNVTYGLGANISAWTVGGAVNQEYLQEAYRQLFEIGKEMPPVIDAELCADSPYERRLVQDRVWTIEPVSSPEFVARAIESAGLRRMGDYERYDDGEH
jgi:hypothetical protein